jgi:hypothetical protein
VKKKEACVVAKNNDACTTINASSAIFEERVRGHKIA